MPKKRYQAEEIVKILREADTSGSVTDTCRAYNITETTYYRWRRLYGGFKTSEVQRLKQLEKENKNLKQLVGDQALALQVAKEELKKRGLI